MTKILHFEQNAKDAVSRLMSRRLIVPKVFFDASWPTSEHRVDMLVIDQAGKGDVHVIEVKEYLRAALDHVFEMSKIPAHYLWVAFSAEDADPKTIASLSHDPRLYPSEGMGRAGVIEVVTEPDGDLTAKVLTKAFRFPGSFADEVDGFTAKHKADIEVR